MGLAPLLFTNSSKFKMRGEILDDFGVKVEDAHISSPLLFVVPLSAIVSRKIGEMIHEMDRCPADFHGFEKVVIENKSFPGRVFLDVAVEGFPQDRSR